MYRPIFTVSLALVVLLLLVRCGGDDCPSCPTNVDTVTVTEEVTDTVTQTDTLFDTVNISQDVPAWVDGLVQIEWGPALFSAYVYGNGGAFPRVDSFQVGDSVCYDTPISWIQTEGSPYFNLDFYEDAALMFVSGDPVTVTLWGNVSGTQLSSSATVVILDYEDDFGPVLIPSTGDTVELVESQVTCEWTAVDNAEWYAIQIFYYLDSSGVDITPHRDFYTYTYGTTFTVRDTALTLDVDSAKMWWVPMTGPDPESMIGNWSGDFAAGKLYSAGGDDLAKVMFVSPATAAKPVTGSGPNEIEMSPHDIARAVYNAYK